MFDWSAIIPDEAYSPDTTLGEGERVALDVIRNECGWHVFPLIKQPLILDPTDSPILPLPTRMAVGVESVAVGGQLLLPGDYQLLQTGQLKRSRGRWDRPIELTLVHGFQNLPRPIQAVMKSLSRLESAGGATQITAGPFSMTAPEGAEAGVVGLNPYQRRALEPYMIGPAPW